MEAVAAAVASGDLRPGPDRSLNLLTYALSNTPAAHDAVVDPAVTGRPLVTIP